MLSPNPPAAQAEPGSKIQFGRVLAHKTEGAFNVGRPYLENVTVEAEILEELKGPKLIVRSRPSPPPSPGACELSQDICHMSRSVYPDMTRRTAVSVFIGKWTHG